MKKNEAEIQKLGDSRLKWAASFECLYQYALPS